MRRARVKLVKSVESGVSDHKKKGDFAKNGKDDVGGNKKQDNSDNTPSKNNNQNAGHGGHK